MEAGAGQGGLVLSQGTGNVAVGRQQVAALFVNVGIQNTRTQEQVV